MKLDMSKAEHFLDFLFENEYLEDTYYETTTLKLEDGTMFEIPQVVSTTIQSYVITVYQNHCATINYQPLSASCLHNVMDSCKSVQRKPYRVLIIIQLMDLKDSTFCIKSLILLTVAKLKKKNFRNY